MNSAVSVLLKSALDLMLLFSYFVINLSVFHLDMCKCVNLLLFPFCHTSYRCAWCHGKCHHVKQLHNMSNMTHEALGLFPHHDHLDVLVQIDQVSLGQVVRFPSILSLDKKYEVSTISLCRNVGN